jgi:hypothetical protein
VSGAGAVLSIALAIGLSAAEASAVPVAFRSPASTTRPGFVAPRAACPGWAEAAPARGALMATSWVTDAIERAERFDLSARTELDLLARFENPAIDRPAAWRSYYDGRYGARGWRSWTTLSWSHADGTTTPWARVGFARRAAHQLTLAPLPSAPEPWLGPRPIPVWGASSLGAPEPTVLGMARAEPCARWRKPRPVTLMRFGAERDTFTLLDCHGAVAPEAIDRLSVMARPPGVPRPPLPLPTEPQPWREADDEWVPAIKMVHPRLVWIVQRLAQAFPWRAIYIVSGYRRDASDSYHHRGRALDLFVLGVANEDVFRFCRTLRDVGCGFYPNNKFVHVDVRPYGHGHPMWIDTAGPSQPSHYVDSWPGVVESGALGWAGEK